jgi:hypothetical protein
MGTEIKFFRLFVLASIFLYPALCLFLCYFLVFHQPSWNIDDLTILFLLTFIIYLINAIVVYRLILKYPAKHISNAFEGCIYLCAILSFIFNIISILFIFGISMAFSQLEAGGKDILRTFMIITSISSALSLSWAIYIAVNSFRLLKIIKKNWVTLVHEIKNIGSSE